MSYLEIYLQEQPIQILNIVLELWHHDEEIAQEIADVIYALRDKDYLPSDLQKTIQEFNHVKS